MPRFSRVLAWLLMSVTLSGCFPVAWIVPPTKLDVGAGVARTTQESDGLDTSDVQRAGGVFDARGSVEPLAAVSDFEARFVDVSAGYGLRYNWTQSYVTHGPFVGATVLVPVGDVTGRRLTLGSQLHAIIAKRDQRSSIVGSRVTGRIGFEWSSWEEGPFNECAFDDDGGFCGGGYSFGEVGFSPYTEVSRAQFFGRAEWAWTFGITLRIPASLGAGIAFINPLTLF